MPGFTSLVVRTFFCKLAIQRLGGHFDRYTHERSRSCCQEYRVEYSAGWRALPGQAVNRSRVQRRWRFVPGTTVLEAPRATTERELRMHTVPAQ